MKLLIKYILVLFLLLNVSVSSNAQSKKELEYKKKQLAKEIQLTDKLLKETASDKKESLTQLRTLSKQIRIRDELISTIGKEVKSLSSEIEATNKEMAVLEKDINKMKEDYARLLQVTYRNSNAYHRLMFIFASDDFNQAFRRLRYLKEYNEERKKQAEEIIKKQSTLERKKEDLLLAKKEQESLLSDKKKEQSTIANNKVTEQRIYNKLKKNEKKLKADLAAKKSATKKLDSAIAAIIKKELEAAKKRAREAGKKNVSGNEALAMGTEAKSLSASFELNMGKLPWPVPSGIVSGRYGTHPHPVLKNITINNNGIDINTPKGSRARSIFDGEVTSVVNIPGANKAVIIRHGSYLTVYANLTDVTVTRGQKIKLKESIGMVANDIDNNKAELHFEIWKGTEKQNPSKWLAGNP
ncbi:MAG: peptidoglycan DD-metalloendopeptidase family protein [Bacteroidia bacterium]|nr:peptidoglycan DD-metalloendopeptidase family protein [Bacteroidia bacterium]NNC84804.1 peptidoglycan DD-metalloendopeptidase family protein [Bacteroidia bacterium]NNM15279.1 peptidoglycan DD-metalloendopeptidase family protein [Bacteroidia bacterium]